jgi:hypothetical protein
MEGFMELGTRSIFSSVGITDRAGKRIGTYIVDLSKDATHRDKRGDQRRDQDRDRDSESNNPTSDEAVIFHSSRPSTDLISNGSSRDELAGPNAKLNMSV